MNATVYALRGLLHSAGIEGTVEVIPNRYWPEHPNYNEVRQKAPWLKVYTACGVLILGWRKRVIHIEWKTGRWKASGSDIVQGEQTTHGEHYCHAWTYKDAAESLRLLWKAGAA